MATDFEDHVIATVNQLRTIATTNPKLAYNNMTKLPPKLHDSIVGYTSRGGRNARIVRKLLKTIEPKTQFMNSNCDK